MSCTACPFLLCNHLAEKTELVVLLLLMPCDCLCSLPLPRGIVRRSAVCDCGISWSNSLSFLG